MEGTDLELVDRYVQSKHDGSDEDIDALLDEVDDDVMARHRERRIAELQRQFKAVDSAAASGRLTTYTDEKPVMELAALSPKCLIHFLLPQFARCQTMLALLERVAATHPDVDVAQIDAASAPFLVTRLGVKVLPLVVGYIQGKERCRLVGFDTGTNPGDSLSYQELEAYLVRWGMVTRSSVRKVTRARDANSGDDDSDSGLDM